VRACSMKGRSEEQMGLIDDFPDSGSVISTCTANAELLCLGKPVATPLGRTLTDPAVGRTVVAHPHSAPSESMAVGWVSGQPIAGAAARRLRNRGRERAQARGVACCPLERRRLHRPRCSALAADQTSAVEWTD
jgi:hypothetical protein